MISLSIIICACNPRTDYQRRFLAALQKQSLPYSQWELLLIDSGPRHPSTSVWDLSWHPKARHLVEDNVDLDENFRRGIREVNAPLLVFLDETCVLDSNYLSEALQISQKWPRLGVWGSGAIGFEFETKPTDRLRELASTIAGRDVQTPQCGNVLTCVEAAPLGTGLCVRANIAAAYCKRSRQLGNKSFDRDRGFALDFAADEICYLACAMGLGMGIFPQLKLRRLIPNAQASKQYLIRHRERESLLRCVLNFEWKEIRPTNPLSPFGVLSTIRNILLQHGAQRQLYQADVRAMWKARRILKNIHQKA